MGKDSLIKSTTKKSGTKKEKTQSKKKTTAKSEAGAQVKEPPAKAKSAKTVPAPKAEPVVTIEDLLFKQFSPPRPSEDPRPSARDLSQMTAPPFFDSNDPQEVARLEALLARRFSMDEITAAAQEPVEITPPAQAPPVVSIEELLFKQFSAPLPPEDSKPPVRDFSRMTAPPFIASDDPQEVARLEALMARRFSMEEIIAVAQAPVEIIPPAQAAEAVQPRETEPETPPAAPAVQAEPAPELAAVEQPPVEAATVAPQPAAAQPVTIEPYQEETSAQATASKPERTPVDPVVRAAKLGIAAVATLAFLILWASFSNSGKYFVLPKKGAIEIWQGNFSPTGKQFIVVLHGLEPVEPVQESYRRQDVYPIIFSYYIDKADALLDVSGLPDYKSITDYLQRAEKFAIHGEMRATVKTRMDNIQRLNLMYKAEIDISKGTVPSLQAAAQALKQIQRLTTDPSQLEAINQKIIAVAASQAALEAKAAADAAAQEQAGKNEPAAEGEAVSKK
ncbi:MAG: hypothetical protein WAU91_13395 [Desulfatitalea sp.]